MVCKRTKLSRPFSVIFPAIPQTQPPHLEHFKIQLKVKTSVMKLLAVPVNGCHWATLGGLNLQVTNDAKEAAVERINVRVLGKHELKGR